MIRVVTGGNAFALQQQVQQYVAAFVAEHGDLALERIIGSEVTIERISEALGSLPFLAIKKLIILDQPSTNKLFLEKFEQCFAEVPDTNEVLVVEPSLDKRTVYYKWLKKETEFQEFAVLDERQLASWATAYAKEQGATLSSSDSTYLVQRVGLGQQNLSQEIDKLALLGATISRDSIDAVTERSPQSTIFELVDSAFAGNMSRAMMLYHEQRALKVEPQQIVAMLGWQLHVLALIKAAGNRSADAIAADAKVSPFTVRKSVAIARSLSLAKLKQLVGALAELDAKSKRSMIDLDDGLQAFLLQLA